MAMAYVVRWKIEEGEKPEFAFNRKDDAIAQAATAIERGETDVEVLDNGKPIPRSAYAPKRTKR